MNKLIKEFEVEDERGQKFQNVLRTPHLITQLYEVRDGVHLAVPLVADGAQMQGAPAYSVAINDLSITLRLHHSVKQGKLKFCLVILTAT